MDKFIDRYTYRVTWSEEDQEYIAMCTEFPSLSWLEETQEEALSGIRHLVKECLSDMEKNGEEAPEPITTKKYSGKFMVRVLPEIHRHLAMEAAEAGVSLNRLIASRLN